MTYYSTDGSFMRLDIPYSPTGAWMSNWTLSFSDGRRVITTNGVQRIYDRNDNYTEIQSITHNGHPARRVLDQLGRFIIVEFDGPANRDYIHFTGTNGEPLTLTVKWKTIYAYKAYRAMQSGTQHGNFYPTTGSNTPIVVDQIILPPQAGSLVYTFNYNAPTTDPYPNYSFGWGELSSITMPSGAQATYAWTFDNSSTPGPVVNRILEAAVTRKDLTYNVEYDGNSTPVKETWDYSAPMNYGTSMTITGPDGGITRNYSSNIGPFARQSYKTENPDGSVIERTWETNIPNGTPSLNSGVNPYVKTEFTSIRDALGNLSVTSIKDYNYDKNGNVTQIKEYDWVSYASVHPAGGGPVIPSGLQPTRITVNTYFNSTPDASDTSFNANVYNQPTAVRSRKVIASTEVRDYAQPFSRTEYVYDNPSTTANLTSRKDWDSAKGAYGSPLTSGNSISVSTQYNPYGGPILTTDAKGFQTQTTYGAINGFTDLYPTEIKTAFGTAVQRTETREYSFHTAAVKRVRDADNDVAAETDFDAFGRPTMVHTAVGKPEESRTATEYSDALRRVIIRSDLSTVGDAKLVTVQHYDQLGRVRLTRQLEDAASQSATDETTGIKVQTRYVYNGTNSYLLTSNPYRAATTGAATSEGTMGWTRLKKDNGGRVVEVQTFGGVALPAPWNNNPASTGTVTTSYDANLIKVTDQSGRVRRSMTDGLGRLTRVDEPDGTGDLGPPSDPNQPTSYAYNVFDNLTTVTQGSQTRTFSYDSLARLRSAVNPESGTITYQYDDNGNLMVKKDARGVSAHHEYDSLNRVTRRWYNALDAISATTHNSPALPSSVGATDEVKFYYDTQALPVGAPSYSRGSAIGRLVAQTYGTGSNGDYYAYDVLGRATLKFQQIGSINYQLTAEYTLSGAMKVLTYPSSRLITNSFDQAGRLTEFIGNLGDGVTRTYATGILYSTSGGLVKEQFGTATPIYNKLFYNSRGQLAEMRVSTSYTGPADTNWNRGAIINHYSDQCSGMCSGSSMTDNNGDLKKQDIYIPNDDQISSSHHKWQQYEYDSLNRLLWARELIGSTEQWKQQFSYDRWGNRTIDTGSTYGIGINNKAFTVDTSNNQLGVAVGQSGVMQYDTAGNLTHDTYTGAGNRTYDAENKITSAWGGDNQAQLYRYDGSGQRVIRTVNGVETWQVYGFGGELVAEYAANGAATSPQKEYGYRNGQLLITAESVTTVATNVALASNGATATASSTHNNPPWSYLPSSVNNGDHRGLNAGNNSNWKSASTSQPQWVEVAFNGSKIINQIDVFSLQDNYENPIEPTEATTFSLYGLTEFDVQYWNGSAWVTVPGGNVTGNNKVWTKFTFAPLTTTKIRVYITATSDNWSRVVEVEAWAASSGANINWLVTDHLGTPRMVFDQTGSLANVKRHDYLPFGEELFAPISSRSTTQGYGGADGVRQQFTSKERDVETGVDYFQARYYGSTHGRFISPDAPFADQQEGDPQSWNLYSYARNNPLRYTDPTGRGIFDRLKNFFKGYGLITNKQRDAEIAKRRAYIQAYLENGGVLVDARTGFAPRNASQMTDMQIWTAYEHIILNPQGDRAEDLSESERENVKKALETLGIQTPTPSNIPQNARDTLDHIERTGQPPAGYQGGTRFANDGRGAGQVLPRTDASGRPISYREYDINPRQPGVSRGTERIVRGSDGSAYYTSDHYRTFTKIK